MFQALYYFMTNEIKIIGYYLALPVTQNGLFELNLMGAR